MSDQSQPSTPQPQLSSAPDSQVPALPVPTSPPTQPGGAQQGTIPPSLISPITGEPFDPEWGVIIQKGGDNPKNIQQVMKPEIERKADQ